MKKYFYSHIVETTSLTISIADLDMSKEERLHLLSLIEANINHEILNLVLSQLDEESKKKFISHLNSSNHQDAWALLKEKIVDVEDQIFNTGEKIKKTFHKDIENAKKEK